jgi:hypothetical protein
MAHILEPFKKWCDSFVDDVSVFSDCWAQHLVHLDQVLTRIWSFGLTLKMSKCEFGAAQISYLGHRVGSGTRGVEAAKVEAIRAIPEPSTKKKLRSFLGAAAFYRNYVPNYSEIVVPLTDLTKKSGPIEIRFTDEQRYAFQTIKNALCNAVSLHQPDYSKEMILRCDASQRTIGAYLSQYSEEAQGELPLAYVSSKLTETQERWSTIEKECFSIIYALKKLDPILYGCKISLYTDHNPLIHIRNAASTSSKLLRWSLWLSRYDITVRYIPGKQNVMADFLSRQ